MRDHWATVPMTQEEIAERVMSDWVCPKCGTKGHLAVLNKKACYCIEKGLVVRMKDV